jgi:hypothetical protein
MTVKFLKLVSGDELIGNYEDNGNTVVISKPAKISIELEFTDPPTQPKSRVDVFAPHAKGLKFTIAKAHILFAEDPHPTLVEYYNNTFLSGLPNE